VVHGSVDAVEITGVRMVNGMYGVTVDGSGHVGTLSVTNSTFVGQSTAGLDLRLEGVAADLDQLVVRGVEFDQSGSNGKAVGSDETGLNTYEGIRSYGFDGNADLIVKRNFNFFNPKAGLFYKTKHTNYYTSIAVAHKEPNRDDFEAATIEQPKQEVLTDIETGFTTKKKNFEYGANIYLMYYKDQLVLTGKINDIGAYTRINVPKSKRIGIELVESWKINSFITSAGNITLSQNKIDAFTAFFDDYDAGGQAFIFHKNTDITMSPNLTANHTVGIKLGTKWNLNLVSKYVSKQYLDNTQNESRILKAYFLQDIHLSHNIVSKPKWAMQIQLYANNVFNKLYEPNGYTYSYVYGGKNTTSNNYFPMAGRNYWLSLKIDLR
jgi:iron complex outermembrane receptor protein